MKTSNIPVATFIYGGFTKKNVDEHAILCKAKPRYTGHIIHKFALPDVKNDKLIFDGKYTSFTGWDDTDQEVIKRYTRLAIYGGINTFFFNLYGGKTKVIMEKPMKIFTKLLVNKEFNHLFFAPMICSSTPRQKLPITVPVDDNQDKDRFLFANKESVLSLVDYILKNYYLKYKNNFFTINDRPVILFFDLPRLGIWGKYQLDQNKVSKILSSAKQLAMEKYKILPYFIAIEDKIEYILKSIDMHVDATTYYTNLTYYSLANEWPIQNYSTLVSRRIKEWHRNYDYLPDSRMFIPAPLSAFDASSRVANTGNGKTIENKKYSDKNWYPLIPNVPWKKQNVIIYRKYLKAAINVVLEKNLPFLNLGPFNEMTEQCALLPFYDKKNNLIDPSILNIVRKEVERLKS